MKCLILTTNAGPWFLRLGFADHVISFFFRFAWGPLPSLEEMSVFFGAGPQEQRPGSHWSDYVLRWRPETKKMQNLSFIEFCDAHDKIELWFDPRPGDQLQLIWLLDHFMSHPEVAAKLVLRLVGFPLVAMKEEDFREMEVDDFAVTEAELQTARMSWQAYRASTPEACVGLLSQDLGSLLMWRPALNELLAELPSSGSGLGATEMRLLEMLARGYEYAPVLFVQYDLRSTHVFGQFEMGWLLEGLAFGPKPAVAGLDEHLRTLPRTNYRDRQTAYQDNQLRLTEFGQAVVAGEEDFSRYNPIDRWWGGTHLTNDNLWRLNQALVKPQG
ncbi:MAG: hypothetical protein PS018_07550 [bacterium]|nr:hypothetical protein [bacterium]